MALRQAFGTIVGLLMALLLMFLEPMGLERSGSGLMRLLRMPATPVDGDSLTPDRIKK